MKEKLALLHLQLRGDLHLGIAQIAIGPLSLNTFLNTSKYQLELQFSLQKCPKPSWQGFRPPKNEQTNFWANQPPLECFVSESVQGMQLFLCKSVSAVGKKGKDIR